MTRTQIKERLAGLQDETEIDREVDRLLDEGEAKSAQANYFGECAGLVKDENWKQAHLSSRDNRRLDALGKVLGTQIQFAETVNAKDGSKANAKYENGVITLALDAKDPVMTSVVHEAVHRLKEIDTALYDHLSQFVQANMSKEAIEFNLGVREMKYGTSDRDNLTEEMVADAYGRILNDSALLDRFVRDDRNAAQKVLDVVRDIINAVQRALSDQNLKLTQLQKDSFGELNDQLAEMESRFTKALNGAETQKNTESMSSDPRYSISAGMSDAERYQDLKARYIDVVPETDYGVYADEIKTLEELKTKAKGKAEKVIIPLAKRLGILNRTMKTPELEIEFQFSKGKGLSKSSHSQLEYGGSYADFAKALLHIDEILEKAVLIERHRDKYEGTIRENEKLLDTSVLLGVFADGNNVIPVQMEVKNTADTGGHLYLTVAMTKIKADVLGSTPSQNGLAHSLLPAFNYRIADIFSCVNPEDKNFLKYVPDDFLSDEQMEAKKVAQRKEDFKIAQLRKGNRQYNVDEKEKLSKSDRDILDEYISKYGAIPKGERPARGIQMPKENVSENEPQKDYIKTQKK